MFVLLFTENDESFCVGSLVQCSFVNYIIDVFKQYNGISMKNKTKEEAYLEMLKPAETITFKVQNCVDNLSAIKEAPGDGFFTR